MKLATIPDRTIFMIPGLAFRPSYIKVFTPLSGIGWYEHETMRDSNWEPLQPHPIFSIERWMGAQECYNGRKIVQHGGVML